MRSLSVALVYLAIVPVVALAHSTAPVSMREANRAMRVVSNRLAVEFEASDFSHRCYRQTSWRVRCTTYFYDTRLGDCSVPFLVTAHRGKTHIREVGGEGNDDCPS